VVIVESNRVKQR